MTSREGTFPPEELELYLKVWKNPREFRTSLYWYRAYIRSRPAKPPSYRVSIPTLILWGAEDVFLSVETARESYKSLNRGELKILEDTSHWIQHERPERVNTELDRFFKA